MKPNVLVVDDDESNRQMLARYLGRNGFEVIAAPDGEAALATVEEHAERPFHLVLLDVMMPGMNGFEVLRRLRARYSEAELPIVMVTALADSADVVEALRLGANDYVTKPFDLRVLLARVQTRLRIDHRDHRGELPRKEAVPFEPRPGALLAERYQLGERVGRGASGDVYAGRHVELDNPVAIKILRLPDDEERRRVVLERFRREGVSACRVKHPNAVTVLDAGVTPSGTAYLVMERLSGHALDAEIKRRAPLSPARASELLLPVCYVLAEAHASGVIHRDVKPANIFVHQGKRGEVVKMLDFGIARLIDEGAEAHGDRIVGTPAYMAPERIRNAPHDGRADVYSLGVILFEMLTAQRPFRSPSDNPLEVARMHLKEPAPSLWSFRSDVPSEIAGLVTDALAKDPAQRPTPEMFALRLSSTTTAMAS